MDSYLDILPQALVSFKKYMPPSLPYFKVNICPFPLPHFASIFFAYLWSFRSPNYIVTLPRYFSFRMPHLNIPPQTNWTRIFSERRIFYLSVIEWNKCLCILLYVTTHDYCGGATLSWELSKIHQCILRNLNKSLKF